MSKISRKRSHGNSIVIDVTDDGDVSTEIKSCVKENTNRGGKEAKRQRTESPSSLDCPTCHRSLHWIMVHPFTLIRVVYNNENRKKEEQEEQEEQEEEEETTHHICYSEVIDNYGEEKSAYSKAYFENLKIIEGGVERFKILYRNKLENNSRVLGNQKSSDEEKGIAKGIIKLWNCDRNNLQALIQQYLRAPKDNGAIINKKTCYKGSVRFLQGALDIGMPRECFYGTVYIVKRNAEDSRAAPRNETEDDLYCRVTLEKLFTFSNQ